MSGDDIKRYYGEAIAKAWAGYAEEYDESDLTPVELFAMGWRMCEEAAHTPSPVIESDAEAVAKGGG